VVALLCITPAAEGGKFRISNACKYFFHFQLSLYLLIIHLERLLSDFGDTFL